MIKREDIILIILIVLSIGILFFTTLSSFSVVDVSNMENITIRANVTNLTAPPQYYNDISRIIETGQC